MVVESDETRTEKQGTENRLFLGGRRMFFLHAYYIYRSRDVEPPQDELRKLPDDGRFQEIGVEKYIPLLVPRPGRLPHPTDGWRRERERRTTSSRRAPIHESAERSLLGEQWRKNTMFFAIAAPSAGRGKQHFSFPFQFFFFFTKMYNTT